MPRPCPPRSSDLQYAGYFGLLRTCNRTYRKGAETRVSSWVLGGRKSDA